MEEVTKWLKDINMAEYADKFEEHGLDRMSIIGHDMTLIDLHEIGINKPHCNYIMRHAKSIQSDSNRSYNYDHKTDHKNLTITTIKHHGTEPKAETEQNSNISETQIPEFDPKLFAEFDDIVAKFESAKPSLNENSSDIMFECSAEIKEYQFHQQKCQKLYSLLLYKKIQLQCM